MTVKMFLKDCQLLMIFTLALVMSACGGSSGSDSTAPVSNDPLNNGDMEAPVVETSDTAETNPDSEIDIPLVTLPPDTTTPSATLPTTDAPESSGSSSSGDENMSNSSALRIWRIADVPGDIEIRRYQTNASSQFGGIGSQLLNTETFNRRTVAFEGDLNGFIPVLAVGDTLPDDRPSTVINDFTATTLGSDGSLAITVRLVGNRPGSALVLAADDSLRVIVRTGEELEPVNGLPFEVSQFESLANDQGKTLFSARPEGVDDFLILLDDGSELRIVAASRETLLGDSGRPRSQEIDCMIGARDSQLGMSLDYLSDFERATLLDDGSVVFPAFHESGCAWGESIMRYNNGSYNVVVAEGQPVPGATEATFRRGARLLASPAGGRMVIGVGVTRDQSVMQPGFGTSFGSATIWEYSVSSPPRLVLAQGESLQTPTAQYFLEGGVFNALTSNFTYGKDSQYVLRAEDLGDGDETAIFVGLPRTETAYTAYESVGASSLEYRVGSLDILPVPFTEDNYFTGLAALRVSGDGQLLFSAVVQDASDSDQRVSRSAGLWIADSANTLRQLIEPGSTHPTVNGDPITISGVDPDIIYDNGVLLNDGNIAYFDSVLGTDLFIELVMQ